MRKENEEIFNKIESNLEIYGYIYAKRRFIFNC